MPKNTALSVKLYKRFNDMTLVADLSERWTQLSYSTALHGGFRDCRMFVPMGVAEAWTYMLREGQAGRHFAHLLIQEGHETRWEGRVMSCGIRWSYGDLGLEVFGLGYWSACRDQRVTTVDYSAGTHTVDSIIKAMLTAKCPSISSTQDGIAAVAGSVNLTLPVDQYPQDHIIALAGLGDESGNTYHFGIWDGRLPYLTQRVVTDVDWEVRLADMESGYVAQDAANARNAADAYDGTSRTASATDAESQALSVARDAVVDVPSGTTSARAVNARDRFIAERKLPQQESSFTIHRDPHQPSKFGPSAGKRSAIRAGQVLKIIDLIPAGAASPSLDNLRTFYLLETYYDAVRDVVTVVPDRPASRLDVLLARMQQLEATR